MTSKALNVGDCAFEATAFAIVLKTNFLRKKCHFCFENLQKKAFQCADCCFGLYCSKKCLEADRLVHDFQCLALKNLKEIAFSVFSDEEKEILRLCLAVLSMEKLIGHTKVLEKLRIPLVVKEDKRKDGDGDGLFHEKAFKFLLLSLYQHQHQQPQMDTHQEQHQMAKMEHLRKTLLRVQFNCHPLMIRPQVTCGIGLFPEAAMTLNHSCVPNVFPVFNPETKNAFVLCHSANSFLWDAGICLYRAFTESKKTSTAFTRSVWL